MDIDALIVGDCYKLGDRYLGKLTAEPYIEGSGDGREKVAHFKHNNEKSSIPRWDNYNMKKKNLFIKVDCEKVGGRSTSSRRMSKRILLKKQRSTRRLK